LFFAQLDLLSCVKNRGQRKYKIFSPFPAISRDISISVKKSIKFKEIEKVVKANSNYLVSLTIVDIYQGKDIIQGHKAFTLRIFYQSAEKTLTSSEVDCFHNQIRERLNKQEDIKLR